MSITYRQFSNEDLESVLELQNEWFCENITFGVGPDTKETILSCLNEYFYIAAESGKAVGYITAEVIRDNEFNIFPKGAEFLRINDLYVAKDYRSMGIGEKLLSLTEEKTYSCGLRHIFISSSTRDAAAVRNFYARNGYDIWTTVFFKRKGWETRVYPLNELQTGGYRYVVVFARYREKWLYCRARERDTFETPGGHIEKGETPIEAARRELYEETGAADFVIRGVFDYSVYTPSEFSNGQVFLAEVSKLGKIPDYEMAEVKLFDTIPDKMRFQEILPVLFEKIRNLV